MIKKPSQLEKTGRDSPAAHGMEIGTEQTALAKQLAQSGEAQQLMNIFKQTGGVQEAAKAAVAGDTSQLMQMVQKVMQNPEGAKLIQQINEQAQQVQKKQKK